MNTRDGTATQKACPWTSGHAFRSAATLRAVLEFRVQQIQPLGISAEQIELGNEVGCTFFFLALFGDEPFQELAGAEVIAVAGLLVDGVDKAGDVLLMLERGIGGLPVVDDDGLLVGIITDHDLFKILVEVCGVRKGGVQIAVAFRDGVGVLLPLFDLLRSHNASLVSMLTADSKLGPDMREVYMRIKPMERSEENKLIEDVKEKFHLLYWVRENVHEV